MAHKHANEMMQFAQDAAETDSPWDRWEYRSSADKNWYALEFAPAWDVGQEYRRIANRRIFGDIEWLAPLTEMPQKGEQYWYIDPTLDEAVSYDYVDGSPIDQRLLERGMAFATEEAARDAWAAMQKIFRGAA